MDQIFFFHESRAQMGLGLLYEVLRSHSVDLLSTSDRTVADTSILQQ